VGRHHFRLTTDRQQNAPVAEYEEGQDDEVEKDQVKKSGRHTIRLAVVEFVAVAVAVNHCRRNDHDDRVEQNLTSKHRTFRTMIVLNANPMNHAAAIDTWITLGRIHFLLITGYTTFR